MSAISDAVLAQTREVIRAKLERGESPQAIRDRTEANLTRRLAGRSEDDPARPEILRAHAAYQRAVESAIREWELDCGGEK